MTTRRRTLRVVIDGIETPVLSVTTTHDVDQPIGTGSLTTTAPRRGHIELGAPVDVYAGYDGTTSRIFSGRIADDDAAFSEAGGTLRIELEGPAKALWYRHPAKIVFTGQTEYREMFRALCAMTGIPLPHADYTTAPNGATIYFGGLLPVDNGDVVIPADTSPGDVLARYGRLFGYRIFDQPHGVTRLKKISGLPVGDVMRAYVQGVNVLDVSQRRTLDGMANYIEVIGAKYKDGTGAEISIRSIPATVPFDARLGPSGVNKLTINDAAIWDTSWADQVRNVYEIDASTPRHRWAWTATGDPAMLPGQVVSVTSPTVGSNTAMWLMRVAHTINENGWTTDMEGWSGAGMALPAGNDCVAFPLVGSTGIHIGNEYLSHYRNPNPSGLEVTISGTIPDDYTTLTMRCRAHGANSFSGNTASTASRFEFWQTVDGEYKSVASGEFPRQDENLELGLDYRIDANSPEVVIPMSGSLKAGAFDLKCISGFDSNVSDYDDYEFFNLTLTACGIGTPVIIGGA